MGNLRQSMTDQEWDDLGKRIDEDKKNGKPDSHTIYLSVYGMPLTTLKRLRESLTPFSSYFDLLPIDAWIKWYER